MEIKLTTLEIIYITKRVLFREVAQTLIKSDYWKEALRNHTLDLNSNRHDTPMRKLIRKMPGKWFYNLFDIRVL